jgi:hypothetical protein
VVVVSPRILDFKFWILDWLYMRQLSSPKLEILHFPSQIQN